MGDEAEAPARARQALDEMLRLMGVRADVEAHAEPDRVVLEVLGDEAGLVIGKKGQTLDALQYLVNKIVNRGGDERCPIVVDSQGYRGRREELLVELAMRLAERAQRTGQPVAAEPMSPQDRRIIHLALGKIPGVTTRSEGEGTFRRLVVLPEGAPADAVAEPE